MPRVPQKAPGKGQEMKPAIKQICGIFIVGAFLIIIGVAGGYQHNTIGLIEAIFLIAFSAIAGFISYVVLKLNSDEEDYK